MPAAIQLQLFKPKEKQRGSARTIVVIVGIVIVGVIAVVTVGCCYCVGVIVVTVGVIVGVILGVIVIVSCYCCYCRLLLLYCRLLYCHCKRYCTVSCCYCRYCCWGYTPFQRPDSNCSSNTCSSKSRV